MFKAKFGLIVLSLMAHEVYADVNPKQFLLDQLIWGETYYRSDFVKNSLDRLQLIAPEDPAVLAARIRFALFQKNLVLAEELLDELKQKAPNSEEYQKAKMSLLLTEPSVQQKLQQARILGISGHFEEAKKQYDALFHNSFPTLELNTEYWTVVSQIPQQKQNAFVHLEALYNFLNAHHIYGTHDDQENWPNKLKEKVSSLWVFNGNKEFQLNHMDLALEDYHHALLLDKSNYSAWIGIADVAFAHKNYIESEKAYKQALLISPGKESAIYGLISIYKHQSLQKALNYIDSFSEDQKIKFKEARQSLVSALLQEQAEHLEKANLWNQALDKYSEAQKIDPDNVWLIYHYANALKQVGKTQQGTALFLKLIEQKKTNPTQAYAYALFLSSNDKLQEALTHLHTIPQEQWDKGMQELAQRLTTDLLLHHAQKLRDGGDKKGAIDYLMRQKQSVPIKVTLADWALSDGEFSKALTYYQEVMKEEPLNPDANLGTIEALIALKNRSKAQQELEALPKKRIIFSLNMQRRIANAWNAVGKPQKALAMYQIIKLNSAKAKPNQDTALLFRDAARLETQEHLPKLATQDYKKAMVQSYITSIWPETNEYYTKLTRTHVEDDWLKHSIRSDAALLYQQQETRITLDEDLWRLVGTPGTSDMRAQDTIAQADWGVEGGRFFMRMDKVDVSAGSFSPVNGITNGPYFSNFGTCSLNGCTTDYAQRAHGISWDGGWQTAVWGFDVGETPIGFAVPNMIGGINYSSEINHIGWTLTASQRPMTNSLLSFAGAVDPDTGIIWGGVVSTGLTLSLSYDRGGPVGFWANVIGSQLTGKNVESNKRILLLEGYYYKLINEENRRFIIGLTNMVWHYEKNVYGFNLGQGGYYSPDFYLSFTLPLDYRQRKGDWSYELGGSVTWSRAKTGNLQAFPLPNLIPNFNNANNSVALGSTSLGYGYSLVGIVERRLGSHFIIGGFANYQQSTDYTPNHFSLFIRYSFEGWQGDMDMPIVPLVPYSNFR